MTNYPATVETEASSPQAARTPGHLPHAIGFWVVAVAYAALSAFGTALTPLWPLYQERDGFGALMVTVAFAALVAGIAAALGAAGHLSDRFGRRRIIVPALIVGIAATFVLIAWPQLPGLLIGRFLTGVAIGLMSATATTYLADLDQQARPHINAPLRPGMVAAGASLGGLALGPIIAGATAEWLPDALLLPYVVFGLILLGILVFVLVTPETVDISDQPEFRVRRVHIQDGKRTIFIGASVLGFTAFGVTGLFSALGSPIIRYDLGIRDVFLGGLGTFAVCAASAAAQFTAGRLRPKTLSGLGLIFYLLGFALTLFAIAHPSLGVFLAAAAVVGAGAGLTFKAGLSQAAMSAVPASRAGVLSIFFIAAFLGMGISAIVLGLMVGALGTFASMLVIACVLTAVLVSGIVLTSRHRS